MYHKLTSLFFIFLFLPIISYSINLNECTTIFGEGSYDIVQKISSNSNCFNIKSSNVEIDCNFNIIKGEQNRNSAFLIESKIENVTLKNCIIENFDIGISINNVEANSIFIKNNNFKDLNRGVSITSSDNNQIKNNIFSNTQRGISLINSDSNLISNNYFTKNSQYGIYLGNVLNNTINNNTLTLNNFAIYGENSQNGVINENIFKNNKYGIFSGLSEGKLFNNIFQNNTNLGIYHRSGVGETIFNNSFNLSKLDFYYLTNSNNISKNKFINSEIGYYSFKHNFCVNGFGNLYVGEVKGIPKNSCSFYGDNKEVYVDSTISQVSVFNGKPLYPSISDAIRNSPSQTKIILKSNAGPAIINKKKITIDCQGFTIEGSKSGRGIEFKENSHGSVIDNCIIKDFNEGVYINTNIQNITINNSIINVSRKGIYLSGNNHNFKTFKSKFYGVGSYNKNLELRNSNKLLISGNEFYGAFTGLELSGIRNSTILSNKFNNTQNSILVNYGTSLNLIALNVFFKKGINGYSKNLNSYCNFQGFGNYYSEEIRVEEVVESDCVLGNKNVLINPNLHAVNFGERPIFKSIAEAIYNTPKEGIIELKSDLSINKNPGIKFLRDGIVLNCEGKTINAIQGSSIAIQVSDKENISINNCNFNNFYGGIEIKDYSKNMIINNSNFKNFNSYAIKVSRNSNSQILESTFSSSQKNAILIDSNSKIKIFKNTFFDSGIDIRSSDSVIKENFFLGEKPKGISLGYNSKNNSINRNIFSEKGINLVSSSISYEDNSFCDTSNFGNYYSEKVDMRQIPSTDCGLANLFKDLNAQVSNSSSFNPYLGFDNIIKSKPIFKSITQASYNTPQETTINLLTNINGKESNIVKKGQKINCNDNIISKGSSDKNDFTSFTISSNAHNSSITKCKIIGSYVVFKIGDKVQNVSIFENQIINFSSQIFLMSSSFYNSPKNLVINKNKIFASPPSGGSLTFNSQGLKISNNIFNISTSFKIVLNSQSKNVTILDNNFLHTQVNIYNSRDKSNKIFRNIFNSINIRDSYSGIEISPNTIASLCENEIGNMYLGFTNKISPNDCGVKHESNEIYINSQLEKSKLSFFENSHFATLKDALRNVPIKKTIKLNDHELIEGTISFHKNNIVLDCSNFNITKDSSSNLIELVKNLENITIKNCIINGGYSGIDSKSNLQNIIFENNVFLNNKGNSIRLSSNDKKIKITNNNFKARGNHISLGSSSSEVLVKNNLFEGTFSGRGINGRIKNSIITENFFNNFTRSNALNNLNIDKNSSIIKNRFFNSKNSVYGNIGNTFCKEFGNLYLGVSTGVLGDCGPVPNLKEIRMDEKDDITLIEWGQSAKFSSLSEATINMPSNSKIIVGKGNHSVSNIQIYSDNITISCEEGAVITPKYYNGQNVRQKGIEIFGDNIIIEGCIFKNFYEAISSNININKHNILIKNNKFIDNVFSILEFGRVNRNTQFNNYPIKIIENDFIQLNDIGGYENIIAISTKASIVSNKFHNSEVRLKEDYGSEVLKNIFNNSDLSSSSNSNVFSNPHVLCNGIYGNLFLGDSSTEFNSCGAVYDTNKIKLDPNASLSYSWGENLVVNNIRDLVNNLRSNTRYELEKNNFVFDSSFNIDFINFTINCGGSKIKNSLDLKYTYGLKLHDLVNVSISYCSFEGFDNGLEILRGGGIKITNNEFINNKNHEFAVNLGINVINLNRFESNISGSKFRIRNIDARDIDEILVENNQFNNVKVETYSSKNENKLFLLSNKFENSQVEILTSQYYIERYGYNNYPIMCDSNNKGNFYLGEVLNILESDCRGFVEIPGGELKPDSIKVVFNKELFVINDIQTIINNLADSNLLLEKNKTYFISAFNLVGDNNVLNCQGSKIFINKSKYRNHFSGTNNTIINCQFNIGDIIINSQNSTYTNNTFKNSNIRVDNYNLYTRETSDNNLIYKNKFLFSNLYSNLHSSNNNIFCKVFGNMYIGDNLKKPPQDCGVSGGVKEILVNPDKDEQINWGDSSYKTIKLALSNLGTANKLILLPSKYQESELKINRDNLEIDCQGSKLIGNGNRGIHVSNVKNLTIKSCQISDYSIGVHIEGSSTRDITFEQNTVKNNDFGIHLNYGRDVNIISNNFLKNKVGINRISGLDISVKNNNLIDNSLDYKGSSYRIIFLNNFWFLNKNCIDILGNGLCEELYKIDSYNSDLFPQKNPIDVLGLNIVVKDINNILTYSKDIVNINISDYFLGSNLTFKITENRLKSSFNPDSNILSITNPQELSGTISTKILVESEDKKDSTNLFNITYIANSFSDLFISNITFSKIITNRISNKVEVEVNNNGYSDVAQRVNVYIQDKKGEVLSRGIIDEIRPQTKKTIILDWTPQFTGLQNLSIIVDKENNIEELNESNNMLLKEVFVNSYDFESYLSIPKEVIIGENFSIFTRVSSNNIINDIPYSIKVINKEGDEFLIVNNKASFNLSPIIKSINFSLDEIGDYEASIEIAKEFRDEIDKSNNIFIANFSIIPGDIKTELHVPSISTENEKIKVELYSDINTNLNSTIYLEKENLNIYEKIDSRNINLVKGLNSYELIFKDVNKYLGIEDINVILKVDEENKVIEQNEKNNVVVKKTSFTKFNFSIDEIIFPKNVNVGDDFRVDIRYSSNSLGKVSINKNRKISGEVFPKRLFKTNKGEISFYLRAVDVGDINLELNFNFEEKYNENRKIIIKSNPKEVRLLRFISDSVEVSNNNIRISIPPFLKDSKSLFNLEEHCTNSNFISAFEEINTKEKCINFFLNYSKKDAYLKVKNLYDLKEVQYVNLKNKYESLNLDFKKKNLQLQNKIIEDSDLINRISDLQIEKFQKLDEIKSKEEEINNLKARNPNDSKILTLQSEIESLKSDFSDIEFQILNLKSNPNQLSSLSFTTNSLKKELETLSTLIQNEKTKLDSLNIVLKQIENDFLIPSKSQLIIKPQRRNDPIIREGAQRSQAAYRQCVHMEANFRFSNKAEFNKPEEVVICKFNANLNINEIQRLNNEELSKMHKEIDKCYNDRGYNFISFSSKSLSSGNIIKSNVFVLLMKNHMFPIIDEMPLNARNTLSEIVVTNFGNENKNYEAFQFLFNEFSSLEDKKIFLDYSLFTNEKRKRFLEGSFYHQVGKLVRNKLKDSEFNTKITSEIHKEIEVSLISNLVENFKEAHFGEFFNQLPLSYANFKGFLFPTPSSAKDENSIVVLLNFKDEKDHKNYFLNKLEDLDLVNSKNIDEFKLSRIKHPKVFERGFLDLYALSFVDTKETKKYLSKYPTMLEYFKDLEQEKYVKSLDSEEEESLAIISAIKFVAEKDFNEKNYQNAILLITKAIEVAEQLEKEELKFSALSELYLLKLQLSFFVDDVLISEISNDLIFSKKTINNVKDSQSRLAFTKEYNLWEEVYKKIFKRYEGFKKSNLLSNSNHFIINSFKRNSIGEYRAIEAQNLIQFGIISNIENLRMSVLEGHYEAVFNFSGAADKFNASPDRSLFNEFITFTKRLNPLQGGADAFNFERLEKEREISVVYLSIMENIKRMYDDGFIDSIEEGKRLVEVDITKRIIKEAIDKYHVVKYSENVIDKFNLPYDEETKNLREMIVKFENKIYSTYTEEEIKKSEEARQKTYFIHNNDLNVLEEVREKLFFEPSINNNFMYNPYISKSIFLYQSDLLSKYLDNGEHSFSLMLAKHIENNNGQHFNSIIAKDFFEKNSNGISSTLNLIIEDISSKPEEFVADFFNPFLLVTGSVFGSSASKVLALSGAGKKVLAFSSKGGFFTNEIIIRETILAGAVPLFASSMCEFGYNPITRSDNSNPCGDISNVLAMTAGNLASIRNKVNSPKFVMKDGNLIQMQELDEVTFKKVLSGAANLKKDDIFVSENIIEIRNKDGIKNLFIKENSNINFENTFSASLMYTSDLNGNLVYVLKSESGVPLEGTTSNLVFKENVGSLEDQIKLRDHIAQLVNSVAEIREINPGTNKKKMKELSTKVRHDIRALEKISIEDLNIFDLVEIEIGNTKLKHIFVPEDLLHFAKAFIKDERVVIRPLNKKNEFISLLTRGKNEIRSHNNIISVSGLGGSELANNLFINPKDTTNSLASKHDIKALVNKVNSHKSFNQKAFIETQRIPHISELLEGVNVDVDSIPSYQNIRDLVIQRQDGSIYVPDDLLIWIPSQEQLVANWLNSQLHSLAKKENPNAEFKTHCRVGNSISCDDFEEGSITPQDDDFTMPNIERAIEESFYKLNTYPALANKIFKNSDPDAVKIKKMEILRDSLPSDHPSIEKLNLILSNIVNENSLDFSITANSANTYFFDSKTGELMLYSPRTNEDRKRKGLEIIIETDGDIWIKSQTTDPLFPIENYHFHQSSFEISAKNIHSIFNLKTPELKFFLDDNDRPVYFTEFFPSSPLLSSVLRNNKISDSEIDKVKSKMKNYFLPSILNNFLLDKNSDFFTSTNSVENSKHENSEALGFETESNERINGNVVSGTLVSGTDRKGDQYIFVKKGEKEFDIYGIDFEVVYTTIRSDISDELDITSESTRMEKIGLIDSKNDIDQYSKGILLLLEKFKTKQEYEEFIKEGIKESPISEIDIENFVNMRVRVRENLLKIIDEFLYSFRNELVKVSKNQEISRNIREALNLGLVDKDSVNYEKDLKIYEKAISRIKNNQNNKFYTMLMFKEISNNNKNIGESLISANIDNILALADNKQLGFELVNSKTTKYKNLERNGNFDSKTINYKHNDGSFSELIIDEKSGKIFFEEPGNFANIDDVINLLSTKGVQISK